MDTDAITRPLEAVPTAAVKPVDYKARGFHLDVSVSPQHLRDVVTVLDRTGFFIETITGVDWLGEKAAQRKEAEAAAAAKAKAAAAKAAKAAEEASAEVSTEENPAPKAEKAPAPAAAPEAPKQPEAPQTDDLEAVYDFNRYDTLFRVAVRVRVPRDTPEIPTISEIYPAAHWHEREARDFFGFTFAGHPYMVPLLLPEDADFHPLRKDFTA